MDGWQSPGPLPAIACERGTCPQGGFESCYVFLVVIGWMLAVVKRSSDEPVCVVYRVSESETVEVIRDFVC
jgi:hypothetical protein